MNFSLNRVAQYSLNSLLLFIFTIWRKCNQAELIILNESNSKYCCIKMFVDYYAPVNSLFNMYAVSLNRSYNIIVRAECMNIYRMVSYVHT